METSLETTRVEDLLAHAEWLRRLAGRLVGPADADDLVQETWKSALRAPPRGHAEDARPWLAKVLRNLSRNRWRARTRRDRTAAAAPLPPAPSAADELLERARTERRLADVVLTLEEPYRSAILLRYYEGKSGAEIAAALGIPAGTVRWRLSEAINRLRARLDDEHGGDRERWRALLLPIAILPVAPAAFAIGKKVSLLAGLAGATVLVASLWTFCSGGSSNERVGTVTELGAGQRRPLPELVQSGATLPPDRNATGGIVEGVVLDPDGAPVARSLVVLAAARQDLAPARTVSVQSDEAGKFRFEDLAVGRYLATATDDRWASAYSSQFILAPGGRHRITLRLFREGLAIEGQVLDEGGGPIPRAQVWAQPGYLWALTGPNRRFETIADDQGRYRLVLEPREYDIRATAPGYAPRGLTAALTRPLRRDIRLSPAALVSGRVLQVGTEQPVAGADVLLSPSGGEGRNRIVRTNESGRFAIEDAEAGNYQLFAIQGSVATAALPLSIGTLDRVDGIVLQLGDGLSVEGRITDPSGRGIGGVAVRLLATDQAPGALVMAPGTRTTLDGAYRLSKLRPGRYRLMADGVDVGFGSSERAVQVAAGGGKQDLHLTPASLLTGRVLGIDGAPARGVLVQLERSGRVTASQLTVTDDQGRFQLILKGEEPMVLAAWERSQGIAIVPIDVAAGARDRHFELRLAGGASLSGQVRFAGGGPAAGASVAVTRQEGAVIYDSVTTDEAGRFELRSLAPGRYTVWARRKAGPHNLWSGRERPEMRLIELGASEHHSGVLLEVAPGGHRIAGIVQLPDGTPAAGTRVVAAPDQDQASKPTREPEHAATSGDDGRFVLEDLEPGHFVLWASRAGFPDVREAAVAAGRTDVVLKLPAAGRIAGRVVTAEDRPVSEFLVSLVPAPAASPSSEQAMARLGVRESESFRSSDGRFLLGVVNPGDYQVEVAGVEGTFARRAVKVASGQTTPELRFVLSAGATLTGKVVVLGSGQPLAAQVEADLSGRYLRAQTDASGHFTLKGIPAGEPFNLEVRARNVEGFVPEDQEIELPPGARTFDVGTIPLLAAPDWMQRRNTTGRLGLRPRFRGGRIVVAGVEPGGPAARAGLAAGDILLAVDGHSLEGMRMGAASYRFGGRGRQKVTLLVQSAAGQRRTVELVPDKP
jgi:RNA polymerase sigma factor (sigma-70 family)